MDIIQPYELERQFEWYKKRIAKKPEEDTYNKLSIKEVLKRMREEEDEESDISNDNDQENSSEE